MVLTVDQGCIEVFDDMKFVESSFSILMIVCVVSIFCSIYFLFVTNVRAVEEINGFIYLIILHTNPYSCSIYAQFV